MPAFVVTLADVRSKRVTTSPPALRLEAPTSSRPRQSVRSIGRALLAVSAPSTARRTSNVGLQVARRESESPSVHHHHTRRSSTSSIVFLHSGAIEGDRGTGNGDEGLIDDLDAKPTDASDELERVKHQMLELQRESERVALEKQQLIEERDATAAANATLEADRLRLLEERDTVVATNDQCETSRLRAELDEAQRTLAQRQREHVVAQSELERRLSDHVCQCDDHTTWVTELRHEKDALQLAWTELELEHADSAQHVEELHIRLVQSQEQLKTVAQQLALAQKELAIKSAELTTLTHGIASIVNGSTNDTDELPPITQLVCLRQAQDERMAIETHRDELLLEASRCEQLLQCSQHEVDELAAANTALRTELATLHAATARAQQEHHVAVDHEHDTTQTLLSTQTHDDLQRQLATLTAQCEAEQRDKRQLQLALDALEASARAKLDAHTRELAFLARFKQQLVRGVVLTKYGTRGSPHTRVVFADVAGCWLSWKPPTGGGSLASPRADATVETRDFVEVLAGDATDVFQRHKPTEPRACFSLVFVRPCRTLDLEAASVDECCELLRGFRLLLEDAAAQRHNARG